MKQSKTYGVVGNGNVATHLLHYFRRKGLNVKHWHRGLVRSAEQILSPCDVVLVLISDDQIESWIKKNAWIQKKIVIHCSGNLATRYAQSFHPLFNFTSELYTDEIYEKIPFIYEKGTSFTEIFPNLLNPSFEISKRHRPLYHALCVMAGNFPTMIWQEASTIFSKKMKLPHDLFVPYIENCVEEFKNNPGNALTGPFVRKDKKTIQKNIKSLEKTKLQPVYKSFAKNFKKG